MRTRGGSSDTGQNALTVVPMSSRPSAIVTRVTPVANAANAAPTPAMELWGTGLSGTGLSGTKLPATLLRSGIGSVTASEVGASRGLGVTVLAWGDDPPKPPGGHGLGGRPPKTPRRAWPGGTTPQNPPEGWPRGTALRAPKAPAALPFGHSIVQPPGRSSGPYGGRPTRAAIRESGPQLSVNSPAVAAALSSLESGGRSRSSGLIRG